MVPLRISGEDEEVIDLRGEEVVIDLKGQKEAQAKAGPQGQTAAATGKTAAAGAAPGPGPVQAPTSATKATAGTGQKLKAAAHAGSSAIGATAGAPAAGQAPPSGPATGKAAKGGDGGKVGVWDLLRTKNGRSVAVALVALMVVAAVVLGSFGNESPVAVIDADPDSTTVTDGHVIVLSGNRSNDPDGRVERYRWDFDEKMFHLVDGKTSSDAIIHGYFRVGNSPDDDAGGVEAHGITLTVTDNGGASGSTTITFEVHPLVVNTVPERIGDSGDFRVYGNLSITNGNGLYELEGGNGPFKVDDTIDRIQLGYHGTQRSSVTDSGMIADGFLREHHAYGRSNEFTISVIEDRSYVHLKKTNSNQPVRDSSGMRGRLDTHIYAPLNLAIRTDLLIEEGDMEVGDLMTKSFEIKGRALGYEPVTAGDNVLHIANISETFDTGMFGNENYGDAEIRWSVDRVQPRKVGELGWIPGLLVQVNIVYKQYEPEIRYVIGDGIPYPLQVFVRIEAVTENGTVVSSDADRYLTGYTIGTVGLPSGGENFTSEVSRLEYQRYDATTWESRSGTPCNAPMVDLDDQNSGDESKRHGFFEEIGNANMFQDQGNDGAIEKAKRDDPEFSDYLGDHPNAYCTWTMYNETHPALAPNRKTWNLTFGEEGSGEYYNVEVRSDRPNNAVTENSLGAFEDQVMRIGRDEIGDVISYASGIDRIYQFGLEYEPLVQEHLFKSNGETDFEDASAGAATQVPYVPTIVHQQNASYAYYAVGRSREVSAMVDATNGQLMYFVHDEGDIDLLWLLQGLSG